MEYGLTFEDEDACAVSVFFNAAIKAGTPFGVACRSGLFDDQFDGVLVAVGPNGAYALNIA